MARQSTDKFNGSYVEIKTISKEKWDNIAKAMLKKHGDAVKQVRYIDNTGAYEILELTAVCRDLIEGSMDTSRECHGVQFQVSEITITKEITMTKLSDGYLITECCNKLILAEYVHNGLGYEWHYVCCGWGHTAGS